MRTLVIGDIHGAHKALVQVLKAAKFDYNNDRLICLGDVADGWTEVPECIEELIKVKNLIYVIGNHDQFMYEWLKFGVSPDIWLNQGGRATRKAYVHRRPELMEKHRDFFNDKPYYFIDETNNLYVHGGINIGTTVKQNTVDDLMWDRSLFYSPRRVVQHNKVFIGHTPTQVRDSDAPIEIFNVVCMDTGAGYNGRLSIYDIDKEIFWCSDNVQDLYPNVKGR